MAISKIWVPGIGTIKPVILKSNVTVVLGLQWGDEGKGKILDVMAGEADWVFRAQGGNNAGHDIGAWILGAAVANRQNQGSPSEFVALATLTLKAFPEMPLGFNQAPTSRGVSFAGQQQRY